MAGVVSNGSVNASDTLTQFQGYFFDTASATSAAQLWALKEFYGGDVSRIVLGTDCEFTWTRLMSCATYKSSLDPYVHEPQVQTGIQAIEPNGNFSLEDMAMINGRNALSVFPSVAEKLGLVS